jgi:hypothetical protein
MSYIGSTPTTQSFIAGMDSFNGTGSATNFTLSRLVNSVNDVQVVVNNVVQYPPNYSVSGNTLTISPAPSSGTNNVYVRYLSTTLQSITIPPGTTVNGDWGINGNLNFSGNARRITGDFSNATVANRVMFQSSTANGNTGVHAIPNGTAVTSNWRSYNNSNPTNASFSGVVCTAAESQFTADRSGTGTFLPMTFYTGGSERMRIATDGQQSSVIPGGTTLFPEYKCRAWVNFNGTGTVAIRASGNVSSITDVGVGYYTVNFTASMPDANFSACCSGRNQASTTLPLVSSAVSFSTTSVNLRFLTPANADQDSDFVSAAVFR